MLALDTDRKLDFQDGLIDKIILRDRSYASADCRAARCAADAGKLRPGGYPVVWGCSGQFSNLGTLERHAATHFPVAGLEPNYGESNAGLFTDWTQPV